MDYFKIQYNDANKVIPLPKKASIYRYSLEVFSDNGELVAYDYKNKDCFIVYGVPKEQKKRL